MTEDRAHARRGDPETSHQAADAITPHIKTAADRVECYAWRAKWDGFTDAEMCHDLGDDSSNLRTRRSEWTAKNVILDSGKCRTYGDSARQRIVWVHRDFTNDPPVRINPDAPQSPAGQPAHLKRAAINMAGEFEGFAISFKRDGRALFAERLTACAQLLRALAS